MVQNSRSSKGDNLVFDFSTPTAVMLILKVLRTHTELQTSVRNEIRDLIFSYTNGRGDEPERQIIEARLLSVGITAESVENQNGTTRKIDTVDNDEVLKGGFSSGRVVPSFVKRPTIVTKNITLTPTIATTEQKPVVDENKTPPIVTESTSISASISPSISSKPKIIPTIPNISATTPTHDIVKPISVSKKPILPKPIPPIQTSIAADTTSSNSIDTTKLLERIRIIKADINTKAGNPVNLVSINNTIGREYMSALLEAMKKLNSGNDSTILDAMKRLEIAYEQALWVIEMSEVPKEAVSPAEQSIPTTPAQTKSAQIPVPIPTLRQHSQVQESVSPTSVSIQKPIKPVTEQSIDIQPTGQKLFQDTPIDNQALDITEMTKPLVSVASTPSSSSLPISSTPIPAPPSLVTTQKPIASAQITEPSTDAIEVSEPASSIPIHSSKFTSAKSVAMATPLRKVEELPTLTEVKNRSKVGNPLYTQEIDEGLEQLLLEWAIFHKSGIFGTGPKGSSHPLFKKLASLKIPLIIAGRFEGATEEVRQSITDYMNGWRYEHGIVYEKEETFEDYLRRMIRHILNSQSK